MCAHVHTHAYTKLSPMKHPLVVQIGHSTIMYSQCKMENPTKKGKLGLLLLLIKSKKEKHPSVVETGHSADHDVRWKMGFNNYKSNKEQSGSMLHKLGFKC